MTGKPDPIPYQRHLQAWRKHRDMTLEQVAEALDVTHTTVSRWEKGEMKITSASLVALCHLYQVSPQELLSPPNDATHIRRISEIEKIIGGMDDEAYNNLLGVAKRMK